MNTSGIRGVIQEGPHDDERTVRGAIRQSCLSSKEQLISDAGAAGRLTRASGAKFEGTVLPASPPPTSRLSLGFIIVSI